MRHDTIEALRKLFLAQREFMTLYVQRHEPKPDEPAARTRYLLAALANADAELLTERLAKGGEV